MTPMDRNPRHFTLIVTSVDVELDAKGTKDTITLQFMGRLLPSTRERFKRALKRGDVAITEKRMA